MDFCSIASGSSGNCIFAGTDRESLLVDVGISGSRIRDGLHRIGRKPEELDAILVTHEHSDHIRSIGVFARKYGIPIYGTARTLAYIMNTRSLGSIDPGLLHPIMPDQAFAVGGLEVFPFRIMHDAADPVGFRVSDGSRTVAVATDMGCYDEYTVDHLRALDAILLEANHDINMLQVGPYPYPLKMRILGEKGHLSNEHAGRLLCEILHDGMKNVLLGHLSKENNYAALAYAAVTAEITMGDNPYRGDDFPIAVAPRDTCSPMIHL